VSAGPEKARGANRLFFALVPESSVAERIAAATRAAVTASRGRPVPRENLHLTVAFLGNLDADRAARARQAEIARLAPFDLTFGKLGYWRRGRILWLEPVSVPAALTRLAGSLWSSLAELGFERESRPFRPHMTLARDAEAVASEIEAVSWRVGALSLVESVPSDGRVRYVRVAAWALGS